jgi:amidase
MEAELAFAGVARLAELLRSGQVSSVELVEGFLGRIDALEPRLNAFRVVYRERVLAEAAQADARRRGGDERLLLGVPIAVKDNMDVAGDVSAYGSRSPHPPAEANSGVVRLLRSAGAVVLGKTHLPELAIFPFGESATWGLTRNPWVPDRTSGGSSSGSATAVAAGMCAGALGSDGGGSIRIPSACCHLFGLKPQRGRVSLSPLPQHWSGLSVFGPITRGVLDSALLLDAVAGPLPGDAHEPPRPPTSYADAARGEPGKLQVAVSLKAPVPTPVSEKVRRPVRELGELLRSLGHEVTEHEPDYGETRHLFTPLWLRGIYDDSRTLVADPRQLDRRTRQMAAGGRLVGSGPVARALSGAAALAERLRSTFDRYDVLLTPALAKPPVKAGRWEGRGAVWTTLGVGAFVPFNQIWNLTGQPAASVPAGFTDDGIPLAVQMVGRTNEEHTLLALAAQVERERQWTERRPALEL